MATNRDLLKEAIADAKAVKEMAIANAKTALEEAFTPRLKEMLSAKIQEMDKDEDDVKEMKYEEDMDEMNLEELLAELEEEEKGEEKVDETLNEAEDEDESGMDDEESEDEEGEPLDLEDMTDEDLKKMIEDVIADMVASGELEGGDVEGEEGEEMEMSDEEEDVDLTELLKEIEEEMNEEEKEPVDEMDDSSKDDKIEKEFAQLNESESLNEEPLPSGPELAMILSGMAAIIGSGVGFVYLQDYIARKAKEGSEKFKKIKRTLDGLGSAAGGATRSFQSKGKLDETDELEEAKDEIKSLKTELSEAVKTTNATNLLNAKLLYTNKIFKSKNLNESQKVKVLSSFDKANTVKESKLIYETLNEGLKVKKSNIKENLGRASKSTIIPTTKKPIVESNDVFARMQKLAGIK